MSDEIPNNEIPDTVEQMMGRLDTADAETVRKFGRMCGEFHEGAKETTGPDEALAITLTYVQALALASSQEQ